MTPTTPIAHPFKQTSASPSHPVGFTHTPSALQRQGSPTRLSADMFQRSVGTLPSSHLSLGQSPLYFEGNGTKPGLGYMLMTALMLFLTACGGGPAKPEVTRETAPIYVTLHGRPNDVIAMADDNDPSKIYGIRSDQYGRQIFDLPQLIGQVQPSLTGTDVKAIEADYDYDDGSGEKTHDTPKMDDFAKGTGDGRVVLPRAQGCNDLGNV